MGSEIALALLAAVLLIVVASESAKGSKDITNMSMLGQLRLGLTCGAIGALLATLPFADVVPDRLETASVIVAISATVTLVIRTLLRRRRRRAARSVPTLVDGPVTDPSAR